jgi:hypothetical protein
MGTSCWRSCWKSSRAGGTPTPSSRSAVPRVADAAIAAAQAIGDCLTWPVGGAAERVIGVVGVRSRGATEIAAWNTPVAGRKILLVSIAAVSALGLQTAAEQLRRRGAVEVHACAVDVPGADQAEGFDSFQVLDASRRSLLLMGDAA